MLSESEIAALLAAQTADIDGPERREVPDSGLGAGKVDELPASQMGISPEPGAQRTQAPSGVSSEPPSCSDAKREVPGEGPPNSEPGAPPSGGQFGVGCETCHDTGLYGDNGPGIKGNREIQECDHCDYRAWPSIYIKNGRMYTEPCPTMVPPPLIEYVREDLAKSSPSGEPTPTSGGLPLTGAAPCPECGVVEPPGVHQCSGGQEDPVRDWICVYAYNQEPDEADGPFIAYVYDTDPSDKNGPFIAFGHFYLSAPDEDSAYRKAEEECPSVVGLLNWYVAPAASESRSPSPDLDEIRRCAGELIKLHAPMAPGHRIGKQILSLLSPKEKAE